MRCWNTQVFYLLKGNPQQQYRTREIVALTRLSFAAVRANLNMMYADRVISRTPTTGDSGKPAYLWQWIV